MSAELAFSSASLHGWLLPVPALGLSSVSVYVQIPSSSQDTRQIGLGPAEISDFILTHSPL